MFQRGICLYRFRSGCQQSALALTMWFFLNAVAGAQDPARTAPSSTPSTMTAAMEVPPLRIALPFISSVNVIDAAPAVRLLSENSNGPAFVQNPSDAPAGLRRITLDQAKQLATVASDPLVRLGQFQVEAAKQHRLGVQSLYFPNVSSQFEDLNFNKNPGELLTVRRPFVGTTIGVPVSIVAQNQTWLNFSVIQPLTPLFGVHQLVKIARADENIARAKAGFPVSQTASRVEKTYYDLLVAERELIVAVAESKRVRAKYLTVSAPAVRDPTDRQTDALSAERSRLLAAARVKALTASLDEMLGLPEGTRLELVPPEAFVENLSLNDAIASASKGNTEVIEAEQTAAKAEAGSTLAKLQYFPSVSVIGGYSHQTALNVVLPEDFSYVGLIATYTLFDSGKREHSVKEAAAQRKAADLGVELTKAKVASGVKGAYFELERSREAYQLAQQMVSETRVVTANFASADGNFGSDDQDVDAARAGAEAEMFRAELEHREAYAKVKSLMGSK
jgi:outer membrane protein